MWQKITSEKSEHIEATIYSETSDKQRPSGDKLIQIVAKDLLDVGSASKMKALKDVQNYLNMLCSDSTMLCWKHAIRSTAVKPCLNI